MEFNALKIFTERRGKLPVPEDVANSAKGNPPSREADLPLLASH